MSWHHTIGFESGRFVVREYWQRRLHGEWKFCYLEAAMAWLRAIRQQEAESCE